MSDIIVGKLVGDRYRVVRRLGAGGMGTVYVAVQEPLGREVALKVVRRDLAGDEKAVERFRREAMTLSDVHHPHIVTLHDFGELSDGALYFAMELVQGENLRQRLTRSGPMNVKKTLTLVRDIASALSAAHARGIIHRDLKPENILLMEAAGEPDFVKIVDFGVAKLVRDDKDLQDQEVLTQRGSVVGTPGYIAPEVALRGVTTDARSDLYALGVLWFECLAGRPPFRARTATALLMAHALDPVPSLPDEIPLPVAGLVQRLLAKSPDDRPNGAEELRALIDTLPPFDTAAGVPRAHVQPLPEVDGDAATSEPRVSPVRNPATQAPPTPALSTEIVRGLDLAAERTRGMSLDGPPLLAPPVAPQPASSTDRRSLIAAAALVALAIVVGLVAGALLLRPPVIAGADAGPLHLHALAVDAGVAHVDAGAVTDGVDAGPKKKPPSHVKKPPTGEGEHVPDLN